ncbi:MAG: efflux RND transporter permease subunit [Pseudomonadota bacterium]
MRASWPNAASLARSRPVSVNSFRRTVIIFGAGVMALGMALLALRLSGHAFGFLIVVGAMGLVGVGLNGTIIILSAFDEHPGIDRDPERMIDILSGPASRHIWSTTITTAMGFVPLILIGGAFWPPFASVFAGGLLGLTVIAFVYTPAAYRLAGRVGPRSFHSREKVSIP